MTALQKARSEFLRLDDRSQDIAEEYFRLVQLALIPKIKLAGNRAMNKMNTRMTQLLGANVENDQVVNILNKIRAKIREAGMIFEDRVTDIKKSIEGGQ